jgi:hypothetical protein
MKRIWIIMMMVFFSEIFFGQDQQKYSAMINEAQNLFEKNEYVKAGIKYSEAFEINKNVLFRDRICATLCWTKANLYDSAFVQLFKIAQDNNFISYNNLIAIPDLKILHYDTRWSDIISKVKTNLIRKEGNLDMSLVTILDTIFQGDQKYRLLRMKVAKEEGLESNTMKELGKKQLENDSINLLKVIDILDNFGWPEPKLIGSQGTDILWLVIQHTDLKTQEKYFPMIKDAVKKGFLSTSKLALLEDRIALGQGKKQIYGTQLGQDQKTGEYYVRPLLDPDNVDKRRAEIGIGPLQDYLSLVGLTWNAKEYKKRLPEIESKEKE